MGRDVSEDGEGGASRKDGGARCGGDGDCSPGAICVRGRCVGGSLEEPDATELPASRPEQRRQAPVSPNPGKRYMFVPIPGAEVLARIRLDDDLVVDEIDLDVEPRVVTVLPGRDVAIALTAGDRMVVVDSTAEEGAVVLHHVSLRPGMTHLSASAESPFVVAWSDHDDLPEGGGNRSEVAVVDLRDVLAGQGGPAVHGLSVGDSPRDVRFDGAGVRLMVVTDDGVSVVSDLMQLQGDGIAKPSRVHEDDLADMAGRRVLPTPDGRHALVLQPGDAAVRLATLEADRRSEDPAKLLLTGEPTDAAIIRSDDPSLDGRRALVVVRERAEALLLDIPGDFGEGSSPEVIPLSGQPMGQVALAPDGESALLFTTDPSVTAVVQLDLGQGPTGAERVSARRVAEPVAHVAYAPSSGAAVAFHPPPGEESQPAFTLLSFEGRFFAKPFTTDASPAWPFVFAPAEIGLEQLIVLLNSPQRGIRRVLTVPTDSFIAETIPLRAPPVGVGLAPDAGAAFVTQDDPEGLITFLGLEGTSAARDVSRFGRSRRID